MLSQNKGSSRAQGPAYREFSRRRYTELRKQLSHLRESEIVARVIKEWETMPAEVRNRFFGMKDNSMVMLNVEPLATPSKDKLATGKKTTADKKREDKQESSSLDLDDINVREFDEASPSKPNKTKMITKVKSEYLTFFNHYFGKLQKEHAKWNPRQITSIIKLLWRKKKVSSEKGKVRPLRLRKPVSARKAFLNDKRKLGMNCNERMMRWKRLPLECRNQWKSIGNPALDAGKSLAGRRSTMKLSTSANSAHSNLGMLLTRLM